MICTTYPTSFQFCRTLKYNPLEHKICRLFQWFALPINDALSCFMLTRSKSYLRIVFWQIGKCACYHACFLTNASHVFLHYVLNTWHLLKPWQHCVQVFQQLGDKKLLWFCSMSSQYLQRWRKYWSPWHLEQRMQFSSTTAIAQFLYNWTD